MPFVVSGQIGVSLSERIAGTGTSSNRGGSFQLGTEVFANNGGRYLYVHAAEAITLGYWVSIDSTYEILKLTATEFNLLRFFMENPRLVLSKSQILDHVWSYDFDGDPNVVETYVSYLRKKLDVHGPPLIQTIRLVGYTLRESET